MCNAFLFCFLDWPAAIFIYSKICNHKITVTAFGKANCFFNNLCMVRNIMLSAEFKNPVMVVSPGSKICTRIFESVACIFKRSQRVLACHIGNYRNRKHRISLYSIATLPVCTVRIIVSVTNLIYARIFKKERSINFYRVAGKANHIITKLCTARRFWMNKFCLMSATKINVAGSIIINNNSRIKKPVNSVDVRHTTGNKSLTDRVFKKSKRRVCRKNSNSICAVCKIQEELILAVYLFCTDCRCPRIACPFCCTRSTGYLDNSAVCPVYQVLRTKNIERIDFVIAVVCIAKTKLCLLTVACTINVNCIVINKNRRVCIKFMQNSRIIIQRHFYCFFCNLFLQCCKMTKAFFSASFYFLSPGLCLCFSFFFFVVT